MCREKIKTVGLKLVIAKIGKVKVKRTVKRSRAALFLSDQSREAAERPVVGSGHIVFNSKVLDSQIIGKSFILSSSYLGSMCVVSEVVLRRTNYMSRYASITSCGVERPIPRCNLCLSEHCKNISFETLRMYIVIHCNADYNENRTLLQSRFLKEFLLGLEIMDLKSGVTSVIAFMNISHKCVISCVDYGILEHIKVTLPMYLILKMVVKGDMMESLHVKREYPEKTCGNIVFVQHIGRWNGGGSLRLEVCSSIYHLPPSPSSQIASCSLRECRIIASQYYVRKNLKLMTKIKLEIFEIVTKAYRKKNIYLVILIVVLVVIHIIILTVALGVDLVFVRAVVLIVVVTHIVVLIVFLVVPFVVTNILALIMVPPIVFVFVLSL
ncbi:hypothetical protein ANN_23786 [Periplaneta americana]|uniref:Uncharacterized protein n=1 Tax=Periplaneta americana TaxID=6978 RepID=A0ABQ8SM12_PERAM|nr:hypothetical protein ANN_23786 [Periplaneta americana]